MFTVTSYTNGATYVSWYSLPPFLSSCRPTYPALLTLPTSLQALNPVDSSLVGVIICKLETHASHSPPTLRGYIAMLAVSAAYRGHGIATALVKRAIDAMDRRSADEIVLETEETNIPAMRLYERLGFLRSKKLHRYYLNGNSAYRLVLLLKAINPDAATDFALDDSDISPS